MENRFTYLLFRALLRIIELRDPGRWILCGLVALFFLAVPGISQNSMITVNSDTSLSIEEIFDMIKKQTDNTFIYRADLFEGLPKVELKKGKVSVDQLLRQSLKDRGFDYTISEDNSIILSRIKKQSTEWVEVTPVSVQPAPLLIEISGRIMDRDGEPLIGVNVLVKGTDKGTATDFEGNFSLEDVGENAVLVVSYIGYQTKEVEISGDTDLTITLLEDSQTLDEVVVVGYGTQKKVSITGAVSTLGSDFLKDRPLTNSSQALQGVQGVYINQVGGQPGADNATIRIRGIGTLNNNEPLVLVDGIEYNLRDVNPRDIESISVLKDAASASIYGSRAANGVVLVTTKKGDKGTLQIEVDNYIGWQQALYLPDFVTSALDYMQGRNQASVNEGQPKPYSDAQVEEYKNGSNPDIYPNTDWYGAMFSVAPMNNHYLNFSGGSEKARYLLSLGHLNQDGVLMGTKAKNYSINSNVIFNISEKLEVGANIKGLLWDRSEPYNTTGNFNSLLGIIPRSLPINPNILTDGRYGHTWLRTPGQNIFKHPVARAKESFDRYKTQRIQLNLSGTYRMPFNIEYKLNLGINIYDVNRHQFIPEIYLYNMKEPDVPRQNEVDPRSVTLEDNTNLNLNFFHTLNWNYSVKEKHNLSMLAGQSYESFSNAGFRSYIEGFVGNELTALDAGTINKDVNGTSSVSRLMSYFGRLNYNYKERYLAEFNFRFDGSSKFARSNRWGFFPSFSLGWRLSEEPVIKSIKSISNLKLRFSWGQLGNQNVGLYRFLNVIDLNQGYSFNNTVVPGSGITSLSDPRISWEETTITNLGLEMGFWKNKLEVNFDLFDKSTTDILASINIAGQLGDLNGPVTNLYGMSNQGIELGLNYRNNFKEFSYSFGGHITYIKNNVDYLNGDVKYTSNEYGNLRVIREGASVESWFGYISDGIFQTEEEVTNHAFQHSLTGPGDLKYRDLNKDGVINSEDQTIIGRSVPKWTYGIQLNLEYKGVTFSTLFQGVEGISYYPTGKISFPYYNGGGVTYDQLENAWSEEDMNAKFPRLSLYKRGSRINSKNSSFWLRDISYLRLKNIQLGYDLPSTWIEKAKISKLRFYMNAQNLLTISDYEETDPEVSVQIDGEQYDYPSTRIYSVGCNIIF